MREATLLHLIELIYGAATDVNGWEAFLCEVSKTVGGTTAGLLQHHVRPTAVLGGMVTASFSLDPEAAERYARHYGALDPWGTALARQKRLDKDFLFTSESLVPFSQLRRSEFYNEFSRHYDIAGNVGFGTAYRCGEATDMSPSGSSLRIGPDTSTCPA